jgi:hypothetical protein
MNSLDQAREVIARALDGAKMPIVCWSGGKDSQLLLKLVTEVNQDVPVLWFRSIDPTRRKFAEQFIADTELMAYSWEPADRYILPNGEGMSLVEEFSFGSQKLPLISDIALGTRCAINAPKERVEFVNYTFDVSFVGAKQRDSHALVKWDDDDFVAPLWHMTDKEVWTAIREMEIPVEESVYDGREVDGPQLCTRCLMPGSDEVFCPDAQRLIPRFNWNPNAALAAFNARFSRAA